jgi:hypothetical protein
MSHVFLSYSRRDQAFVDRLIAALERAGLDVWIDRDDIPGGAEWEATITRAVKECGSLAVVLSPAAAASEYVPKELSLADKFGRPIVPVLYQPWDETSDSEPARRLDFQLAGLQYVDFVHQPFEAGVSDLLRGLRREARAVPAPAAAGRPRRGWLAAVGVALGVAALAAFLLARGRAPADGIDGSWQSDVVYAWGPHATERFRFILDGDTVNGTASFLGAPRGIQDGRLKDGRLTFRTRVDAGPGSPQFWNAYRGRVDGDVIHFLLQDDRGSPPLQFTAERGG